MRNHLYSISVPGGYQERSTFWGHRGPWGYKRSRYDYYDEDEDSSSSSDDDSDDDSNDSDDESDDSDDNDNDDNCDCDKCEDKKMNQDEQQFNPSNMTDEQYIKKIGAAISSYGILGIKPGASAQEIRKAYTFLSKKVHPDKNKSHGATEAFKKLQSAYNSLKKRAK